MLQQRPFVPFRIHLADGTVYGIRHPELVIVRIASAIVAFPDPKNPGLADAWELVALRHVVRLEPIPSEAAAGPPAGAAG
jgi:hypothetical protein